MFTNKKKEYYKKLIDQIQKDIWLEELKQVGRKGLREKIRLEFDQTADKIKGIEEAIEKVKADTKISSKERESDLAQLYDAQHKFELDKDKLQEQMMGKYVESEKQYHGGLDEEIGLYNKHIEGRDELITLIKIELKKL